MFTCGHSPSTLSRVPAERPCRAEPWLTELAYVSGYFCAPRVVTWKMKAKINKRQSTRYEITNAPTDPKIKKKRFYRCIDRWTQCQRIYRLTAVPDGDGMVGLAFGLCWETRRLDAVKWGVSFPLLFFGWSVRMRAYKYLQSTQEHQRESLRPLSSSSLSTPPPSPLSHSLSSHKSFSLSVCMQMLWAHA